MLLDRPLGPRWPCDDREHGVTVFRRKSSPEMLEELSLMDDEVRGS